MAARTAVVAGTATAVSGRVARRQANKYAEQDGQPVEQVAAPAGDPTADKITQLAELHASGALTDEEFAAAKAKALGI